MRTTLTALAATAALSLAGCGGGDDTADDAPATPSATSPSASSPESGAGSPTPAPRSTPADEGPRQDITIRGDQVSPSAKRVDVGTAERLTLSITSDRAGELHVHSTPEQELAFGRGTTVLGLVVDSPGIVEVEDHESGAVILRVYVS